MTDKILLLEYVCTGNNGRSPMAEAIAEDYVHREGLADRVKVYSSGSGLPQMDRNDAIKEFDHHKKDQRLAVIRLALKGGIYQEPWRQEEAAALLEAGQNSSLERLQNAFDYAVRVEAILRDQVLFENRLVATRKYHQSTAARSPSPNLEHLILPMAASNANQVKQIYGGLPFEPKIALLNEYAGMEGDVPNPFCQLLPAYREARDHLMVAVPRTVDRAVRELLG